MLYPFMTLDDDTEIVHSETYLDNGKEVVRVEIEKPVHVHVAEGTPVKNGTKIRITKAGNVLLCHNGSERLISARIATKPEKERAVIRHARLAAEDNFCDMLISL